MIFVNLPLRYVRSDPSYLKMFMDEGVNPELGLDHVSLDVPDAAFHRETADALRRAGLSCAVHLPFMYIHPGAADAYALEAARRRLDRALEIARFYEPAHLIGHADLVGALEPDDPAGQIRRTAETWRLVLDSWPGHPPLYLENTYETEPHDLRGLLDALVKENAGCCFDVGHWHSFAGGAEKRDLALWLTTLAPHIRHFHLHDNDGSDDHHVGLGAGTLPFAEFFALCEKLSIRGSATLEPHTREAYAVSRSFIEKRGPEMAAILA